MKENLKKIAFLDRDGVINKNALPHEYITSVAGFEFNPGIFLLLRLLKDKGFELVVISNQRGIARGKMTIGAVEEIHRYMKEELAKQDLLILDIFFCPHEENMCDCRKPKPGLVRQALEKYSVNLIESILISDSASEEILAKTSGIGKFYFVPQNHPEVLIEKGL